jgi:DNA-binding transcriptional ArsR family regulator
MLTCETREAALARVGRALADPTRCRILIALLDGANYPGQIAEQLGLTRSNVSNHLSCLRGCGLVVATYQGRQVHYVLADAHLAHALGELVQVVLAVEPAEDCQDEQPTGLAAQTAATVSAP